MNSTINTFATLLRETLYNSRKDTITLDQEIQTLKHYVEIEQLMASKSFTYAISIDSDLDPEEILIPPMLIQPFVENAVRHGILKGSRQGELKIQFHTTEEFLHCTILDNGVGIFQSQKNKTKTDHQSMALTVTRERLESISGKDALDIKEIVDGNAIAGTEIAFKIPLETDYLKNYVNSNYSRRHARCIASSKKHPNDKSSRNKSSRYRTKCCRGSKSTANYATRHSLSRYHARRWYRVRYSRNIS